MVSPIDGPELLAPRPVREPHTKRRIRAWSWALGALALSASLGAAAFTGGEASAARCARGSHPSGPRCCPVGQDYDHGLCRGTASACPRTQELAAGACLPVEARLLVAAGTAGEAPPEFVPRAASAKAEPVDAFLMDRTEVTEARWAECAKAGVCPRRGESEPAQPVRAVEPPLARTFCQHAGGDLPTGSQWRLAAAGVSGRRFPWGMTGLVCRRAAFGMVSGPCAEAAEGPDAAGARPDGATPEGILDLSGSVAEWTREPGGAYRARGGSYRSSHPRELTAGASEDVSRAAPHIGFRCVYAGASRVSLAREREP